MEALQFNSTTKKLHLNPVVPIPKITHPDEVLIKVAFSGVCGTDLHIIQGHFPCKASGPLTLGHEFCGTVAAVGSNCNNVTVGDVVVIDPNNGCHRCRPCQSGNPHFCEGVGFYANLGVRNHGGWAAWCLCSREQVHRVPEGIGMEAASLAEPLSCVAHGWDLLGHVEVGMEVLVIGAGIIGTLWACILHLKGHRRVTIVEAVETRLRALEKLNLGFKLATPLEMQTNGYFDLVIDCSGNCAAIESGISRLNSGGKICMFGVTPPAAKITISPFAIYLKELTLLSVNVNPFSFPKALGLIESMQGRYLDYNKLGVKVFDLQQYEEALDSLKSGKITKAMFKF